MDRPKICLFCTEEGHWRQDCPEAQEYDRRKAEKQAQAAGKPPSVSMVQIEQWEPEACVVTRAGTVIQPKEKSGQSTSLDWAAQDAVRQQVTTWIQSRPSQQEYAKTGKKVSFQATGTSSEAAPSPLLPTDEHESAEATPESQLPHCGNEDSWDSLLDAPIQVKLGQLLRLVPNFHKALLPTGQEPKRGPGQVLEDTQVAQVDPVPEGPVTDTRIPKISVNYRGLVIDNVLIDGGAGVNIVTKATCEKFGWLDWRPVPFLVRMADQRRVRPLGILRDIVLDVGGISFAMAFVVMGMEDTAEEYSMLLGRPWLRQAKVRHNWEANQLSIRRGRRKVKIPLREKKRLNNAVWPVIAETVNMLEGLEDDEEEQFLQANADLVPLCSVDVAMIAATYTSPQPEVFLTGADAAKVLGSDLKSLEEFEPEDDLQTILEKERAFEALMSKVTRVQEDVLETVYLGEDQVSKPVKISTLLDKGFRSQLVALLGEFRDVFAWEYSDMKGLDPQFYQHRIHLKPDAIPSRQVSHEPAYGKASQGRIGSVAESGLHCSY